MDAAALPNGDKPRRDVDGVPPEIEAELAPADDSGDDGPDMQAAAQLPASWPRRAASIMAKAQESAAMTGSG